MSTNPDFAFIDESGVLAADPNQPFFALGLLLIEDTSRLFHELQFIRNQAISGTGSNAKEFEFKFKCITRKFKPYYERIIEATLAHPVRVCIFITDKSDATKNVEKHFKSVWDAYLGYSKMVIRKNVERSKQCIVLADQLDKPKEHPLFLESELRSMPEVINATMLESHASMFIQMIDVLTGAVVNSFRRKKGGGLSTDKEKIAVSNYLANKLNVKSLAQNLTIERPIYFTVWKFSPL